MEREAAVVSVVIGALEAVTLKLGEWLQEIPFEICVQNSTSSGPRNCVGPLSSQACGRGPELKG